MPEPRLTYAVVMPVRDEEAFLAGTARCLLAQDRRPAEWVIVDDGSADATGAIADALAAEHDWISVVHRPRSATRERGGPIVRAFEAGRASLRSEADVVVKLDGDLHLPAHYFAWVMDVFESDVRAGIVGGTLFVLEEGRWVADKVGRHTVHGAVKAYRASCLEDIGGLRETMGWDGIDEYGARARGWDVVPVSALSVLHFKPRGSKQRWWRARVEEGRGMHYMGYGAPGVLLRVGYRALVERPAVLSGGAMAFGFLRASVLGADRVDDPRAIALLRSEHRARLLGVLRRGGPVVPPPVRDPAMDALAEARAEQPLAVAA